MRQIIEELQSIFQKSCGEQFRYYYAGKISSPMKAQLPLLCVYGTATNLVPIGELTTCRDKYRHNVSVDIFISTYKNVSQDANDVTQSLKTQLELYDKMEKKVDGVVQANTVLGALRHLPQLKGKHFTFIDEVSVDYTELQVDGSAYHKATATFQVNGNYVLRS